MLWNRHAVLILDRSNTSGANVGGSHILVIKDKYDLMEQKMTPLDFRIWHNQIN